MYTFDSRIRYSETDENAVLTIGSLINYFQDWSTFQTEDSGAGLRWLMEQHLAWVLSYWQIDITRLPLLYEHVRIGTVPYSLKGFMGLRNYCMDALPDTGEGAAEHLAVANSVWALMDMDKMVPARITEEHASCYHLEEKLEMEYLDRKVRIPGDGDRYESGSVTIGHGHLDTNRHVNNGQYVRMALDAVEQLQEKRNGLSKAAEGGADRMIPAGRPLRIRAEYKKQAHLGDVLVPVLYERNNIVTVDLQLEGESCCVVEIS